MIYDFFIAIVPLNISIEGSPDHLYIISHLNEITIDLSEEKVSITLFYINARTFFVIDLADIEKISVDFDTTILSQEQADLRPHPIVVQQSC